MQDLVLAIIAVPGIHVRLMQVGVAQEHTVSDQVSSPPTPLHDERGRAIPSRIQHLLSEH